jgi:vitamin K-dependent gamma-carboxylase
MGTRLRSLVVELVQKPVDVASLAAFRIMFGLLMAGAMIRFLVKGWVSELYIKPIFHFSYPGFEWVRALPDGFMQAHFIFLALLGLGIAAGFLYRACVALFFLGFTYVELIDQTLYLNHYYLVTLLSFLMIFVPANAAWSIDALRRPEIRRDLVPGWTLNILRLQIAIVYLFAGLAKLNADWLFRAQPLRIWLAARSDLPLIGGLLDEAWVAFVASWVGAAFDLSIVFFLLRARTRRAAYVVLVVFHLATLALFNIGMFPWIMIVSATLFFAPSWPRHFVRGKLISEGECARTGRLTYAFLAIYLAVQLWLPLRPYFQSQPAAWTGSGFNLAWQVMIAEKSGYVEFIACDPNTGARWKLSTKNILTPRQEMMMSQDPYLLRAMARHFAQLHPGLEIRCNAFATLNGRPAQRLIVPEVDLVGALPARWIIPLKQSGDG